jgi:hypothetical protein
VPCEERWWVLVMVLSVAATDGGQCGIKCSRRGMSRLVWCNAQTGKLAEVPGCAVRRLVSRHVAVWARQSGVIDSAGDGCLL